MPLAGIQRTRRFAASGKARMRCRHRVDSTSTRLALVVAEMADGNPATNMAKKKRSGFWARHEMLARWRCSRGSGGIKI